MQDFSLHTHTIGFDGKNTCAEMVARAAGLGMTAIGISNHFIVHPNIRRAPMYKYAVRYGYNAIYSESFDNTIAHFQAHYDELGQLAQTSGIRVLRGMEVDYFTYPGWRDEFMRALRVLQPDYVIGAAHFIDWDGTLCNTHDAAHATPDVQRQMLAQYWANVRDAAASGLFTWMAHLDLFKKVGLGTDDEWVAAESSALDAIAASHTAMEINTSLYECGNEPYPSPRIVKMAVARNIPILFSDDAHAIDKIGRFWGRGGAFARKCGVKNTLSLQKILDFRTKTL